MSEVKKVPPYLRHTKPPYIIHPYSPVLAARPDMVPWYKAPEIKRVEPIQQPVPAFEEAPETAMSDEEFARHAAEKERLEALRKQHSGEDKPLEARKAQMVDYDLEAPTVIDFNGEEAPMTEEEFDRIKQVEAPQVQAMPASVPHINDPVETTPEGMAAKRHGKPARPERAVDRFQGVAPKEKKSSPFARPDRL